MKVNSWQHAQRLAAAVLLLLAAVLALYYGVRGRRAPALPVREVEASASLHPPGPPEWEEGTWEIFRRTKAPEEGRGGPLAQRFRLAGTFFAFGQGEGNDRRAILDDLVEGGQRLVAEDDRVDQVRVVCIFSDRIVLEHEGREEQLLLSFPGRERESEPGSAPTEDEETILDSNRFGQRVGETRWVLRRDALMQYYREMLDDPERVAALFESLRPDYDAEAQIQGYILDMVGEEGFFGDVGLRQGDAVRKVNSLDMISQRRAEYLIGEFVQNRANAFVLDIEREGAPLKLIYLIR